MKKKRNKMVVSGCSVTGGSKTGKQILIITRETKEIKKITKRKIIKGKPVQLLKREPCEYSHTPFTSIFHYSTSSLHISIDRQAVREMALLPIKQLDTNMRKSSCQLRTLMIQLRLDEILQVEVPNRNDIRQKNTLFIDKFLCIFP